MKSLNTLKKVHIVGICGTLMGAFAAFLKRQGARVTGSDQNVYPPMSDVLKEAGIELYSGYRPENLTADGQRPDLVVIGNVISANNPEARAAIDGGYDYSSLPEAMERYLLAGTRNLVVAGTHGKTTTSSMLAHVLASSGREPGWFIGGVSQDLPYSFQIPSSGARGGFFVLEGDEYDTAFWDKVPKFNHYLPDDVILTSVEFDHADIYADLEAVVRAFDGLMQRIRPGGRLIACADYENVARVTGKSATAAITYASKPGPGVRYWPEGVRCEGEWIRFGVRDSGQAVAELALGVPGNHNVLNALAVWIECRELGLEPAAVQAALKSFRGVKRRQETKGEVGGVLVIDDFAHHPTAVRETLRALRSRYPGRRITAVFEPRSATSRRKIFQREYALAFGEADAVVIAKPYDQSKIAEGEQFSSDQLVGDLAALGKDARVMATVDEGAVEVARRQGPGDLVAVLSNGGFGGFIPKLMDALRTRG